MSPSASRRRLFVLAPAALALAAGVDAQETGRKPPVAVFGAGVEAVTVDVVVLDGEGRPVKGLSGADFAVEEDGVPQALTGFRAVEPAAAPAEPEVTPVVASNEDAGPERGRVFLVVFDDLHMTSVGADRAKAALSGFLDGGVRPGDHLTLAATSGGTRTSARLPGGRARLAAWVEGQRGRRPPDDPRDRITAHEAYRVHVVQDKRLTAEIMRRYYDLGLIAEPFEDPTDRDAAKARRDRDLVKGIPFVQAKATEIYRRASVQVQAVLTGLRDVLDAFSVVEGRKTVVLLSEGFFHEPGNPLFAEVAGAAQRANAAVYFVDARVFGGLPGVGSIEVERATVHGDSTVMLQDQRETEGAETVALDTGGLVLRGQPEDALARVARESESYYLLYYSPAKPARDGGFRRIEVTVARPDVAVRARRGYAPAPPAAVPGGPHPDVRRALDSPLEIGGVPLRLASYALGPAEGGRVTMMLAGEAAGDRLAWASRGGRLEDALETHVRVTPLAGGDPVDRERRLELSLTDREHADVVATGVPLLRDFDLAPGRYLARLVVRDANSGRVGSVLHGFEVPEEGFRLSTPMLTDLLHGGASGGAPRPIPLARRTFETGRKLYCGFQVLGATADPATGTARVSTELAVFRPDGTALARTPPQHLPPGPGGDLSRLLALSLERAVPGDYELVLRARDEVSGRTDERREAFQVRGDASAGLAADAGPGYETLLAAYRRGDTGQAVTGLQALGAVRARELSRSLPAGCDARCSWAAALMHTDAAVAGGPGADGQLAAARDLVEGRPDSPEARRRRRDWLLVVGYHHQGESRFPEALRAFDEAARLSPGDAEVLLAQGTVAEVAAILPGLQPGKAREAAPIGSTMLPEFIERSERERLEKEARDLYERALSLDPGLLEARLRRGRLLLQRGKEREASADLETVAREATEPYLQALAHLFLAGLAEKKERGFGLALTHYDAALAARPGFQAATVGRAHALHRLGKPRAAAAALEAGLAEAPPGEGEPWTGYHLGLAWRRDAALQELRRRLAS